MIGKINERGHLEIKRKSEYKYQNCPFDDDNPQCGDWCPLFEEPIGDHYQAKPESATIAICQGKVLNFKKLTDERE